MGKSEQIGGPATLWVTATVLTSPLRPTHTRWNTHAQSHATQHTYIHTRKYTYTPRYGTFERGAATQDIRVLSYPFYHNNLPTYKYTRSQGLHEGRLRRLKGTGSTLSSCPLVPPSRTPSPPSPSRLLFFSFFTPPSDCCARSSLFLGLQDSLQPNRAIPLSPPFTSRIKPFNCRIVFDGSFPTAELLFKVDALGSWRPSRRRDHFRCSIIRSPPAPSLSLSGQHLRSSCLLLFYVERYVGGEQVNS